MYDNPQLSSMLFTLHIQCVLYRSFENNVNAILYIQYEYAEWCLLSSLNQYPIIRLSIATCRGKTPRSPYTMQLGVEGLRCSIFFKKL